MDPGYSKSWVKQEVDYLGERVPALDETIAATQAENAAKLEHLARLLALAREMRTVPAS